MSGPVTEGLEGCYSSSHKTTEEEIFNHISWLINNQSLHSLLLQINNITSCVCVDIEAHREMLHAGCYGNACSMYTEDHFLAVNPLLSLYMHFNDGSLFGSRAADVSVDSL